ncbi:MarR family transcriptional regulator [Nitrospirillum viridazoti Y2]|uniref:DNA-binding MarR family transcriptional regulator n=1 Tax=Nitrospirillum amazonense TaxID=28077 RepID=A0A560I7H6_9PROT|nr:MarR family winged helix-turn-helix transcriptional regulator [Nitrospirillum amazonense]EGY01797.1 MarR family transcriptional regulator [Nitrospirillum amazonense Y2]TWB54365.1 DNA-binding MarR family transcriptional regulator [Nitrospirillum amazonense]
MPLPRPQPVALPVSNLTLDMSTPDMGPKLDMERYVPAFLNSIANKLSSGASRLYFKHFGIGVVEWRIIVHLVAEPWCTAARICQIIGMDKAAVSRSYALMEDRGLIQFRPAEPRGREAALTVAGRDLHDRILVMALERERRLLADFSPREVDTLINLLGRLQARIPHVNAYDPTPEEIGLSAGPGEPAKAS